MDILIYILCIKYSIDIIPYCVNFFCTKFDICALFHQNIIVICIRYKSLMSLYICPCLFLLHTFLVMSAISLIVDTSKHGWEMVQDDMMKLSLVPSCCQYQFMLDFIILRYSNFEISPPDFMT